MLNQNEPKDCINYQEDGWGCNKFQNMNMFLTLRIIVVKHHTWIACETSNE